MSQRLHEWRAQPTATSSKGVRSEGTRWLPGAGLKGWTRGGPRHIWQLLHSMAATLRHWHGTGAQHSQHSYWLPHLATAPVPPLAVAQKTRLQADIAIGILLELRQQGSRVTHTAPTPSRAAAAFQGPTRPFLGCCRAALLLQSRPCPEGASRRIWQLASDRLPTVGLNNAACRTWAKATSQKLPDSFPGAAFLVNGCGTCWRRWGVNFDASLAAKCGAPRQVSSSTQLHPKRPLVPACHGLHLQWPAGVPRRSQPAAAPVLNLMVNSCTCW